MVFRLPESLDTHTFRTEIALLFQAALLLFIFTVVVGILNGADLVDFDQQTLLTHVHTGTLGWITLNVFAASLWLFGDGAPMSRLVERSARWLSYLAVAAFVAYNIAFLTTYGSMRPTIGGIALATIAGFFVWVLVRARTVPLTTPHLGILAAVATSVVGGVLGVLLGIELATGRDVLPDGGEEAHPATMVIGFLVPVGMALAEWALHFPRPQPATRLGVAQMTLPFVGGLLVAVGLLLDLTPLIGLSLPFEVAGVAILIRRMWPAARLARSTASRFAVASLVAIVVDVALFVFLVGRYQGDLGEAPVHQILALDHTMFIGVMTNAILGLLIALTAARLREWPRVEQVILVGVNVGLVGFAVGLFFDVTVLKQIFTPILGAALLLAIGTFLAVFIGAVGRQLEAVPETGG